MKLPFTIKAPIALFMLAAGSLIAAGQTPTPKPTSTPPATAQNQAVSVPLAKIAVVSVADFSEGITELKQKYEKLNREFAPQSQELQSMQNKLSALQSQLEKAPTLTQQQVRKLQDDAESLKKEIDRKTEDAKEALEKRQEQELGPVYEKVNAALAKFAEKHGITVIFEIGRALETGAFVYVDPRANITEAFVQEYNRANPVAAASTSPAPKNP